MTKRTTAAALLPLTFLGLAVRPCFAQNDKPSDEPIEPDRPGFANGASVVPQGRLLLEGGYRYTRQGDEREHNAGDELTLRVSTGPRMELRVVFPSYLWTRTENQNRQHGFDDATIGAKFQFLKGDQGENGGKPRPGIALIAQTTLPTGSRDYREDALQPEATLCVDYQPTPRLGLEANLDYAYLSDQGERFHRFAGALSVQYELTERAQTFLEYYGLSPRGKNAGNASYVDGGFTYRVNDDLQLDASAGVGLNGEKNDFFLSVGAARRF